MSTNEQGYSEEERSKWRPGLWQGPFTMEDLAGDAEGARMEQSRIQEAMEKEFKAWKRRTRPLNDDPRAKEKSAFFEGFIKGRLYGFDEGVLHSDLESLEE